MRISIFALAMAASVTTGLAAERIDRSAAFVLGGRYHTEHQEDMFNPLGPFGMDYEDNFLLGGGYQRFFLTSSGLSFGWEVGTALRFGEDVSGELWGGGVLRYDGLVLGDVRISPAISFGLSAVTNTMGVEAEREAFTAGGDATLLFYSGPEINLSWKDNPNMEVFMRVQHRSGGWGALGEMGDGANANSVGMRWHW